MDSDPLRVYVDGDPELLQQPGTGRIFWQYPGRTDIEVVPTMPEADCIFANPGRDNDWSSSVVGYVMHGAKYVWFSNSDNPSKAYDPVRTCPGIKVLAQPMTIEGRNTDMWRIITSPLCMGSIEWAIVQKQPFLDACRAQERTLNFVFSGGRGGHYRGFLTKLKLPGYKFHVRPGFWNHSDISKVTQTRDFLQELATSKFTLAPRGMGHSSFRLYQALSVGTIPIISGMKSYPYADEVDWSKFSIICEDHKIDADHLLSLDWEAMSQAAIAFWDEYIYMPRMCDRMIDAVRKELKRG
jgi:hypothetical protein